MTDIKQPLFKKNERRNTKNPRESEGSDCGACSDVVPVAGLEPARINRRILSAVRLPIPPHRRSILNFITYLR